MTKDDKSIIILCLIGLTILLASLFIFASESYSASSGLVLYVSSDCPHCQNLKKFIADHKVEDKIHFQEKEIHDPKNLDDLVNACERCGILQNQVGVPLLTDGQRCITGDEDIIDYLAKKMK